jgi:hypothetical protein
MSYYGTSTKPECFADDDEYDDRTAACRGCGFRQECANALEQRAKKESNVSYYTRPRATTSASTSTSSEPVRTYSTVTKSSGIIKAADVDFNFNKPILNQFTTYLSYDIAQVTTERVHSLITAARENYKRKVMQDEE